jgi:hypothetical protein
MQEIGCGVNKYKRDSTLVFQPCAASSIRLLPRLRWLSGCILGYPQASAWKQEPETAIHMCEQRVWLCLEVVRLAFARGWSNITTENREELQR